MRSTLTILTPEEKELPLPYDVPIFIGPSIKKHRQTVSFTDAEETVIPVALDQKISFKDPVATIQFYDQISAIGDIKSINKNAINITAPLELIEPMSSRQCLCALLKPDNSISTVIGIDRFIYHTAGTSLSAIQLCEPTTPGEATKVVILGLKKLIINGEYDIISHTVKIKYEKNAIHLPVDKLRSFIECDIINNDRSYIADPKALIYPEQNSDILLGINKCEKKSIVIPAYTQSEKYVQSNIREVLDAIDLRNQGAYIAPIDASTELRSALVNYVKSNDKRVLLLPGPSIYSHETKSATDETLNHSGGGTVTFASNIFALVAIIRYEYVQGPANFVDASDHPEREGPMGGYKWVAAFDAQRDAGVPYVTNWEDVIPALKFTEDNTFYLFYCNYDTPFKVENPYIAEGVQDPSAPVPLDGGAIRIAVEFNLETPPYGTPPFFLDAISLLRFNPPPSSGLDDPNTPWPDSTPGWYQNDNYLNYSGITWVSAGIYAKAHFARANYLGAFRTTSTNSIPE